MCVRCFILESVNIAQIYRLYPPLIKISQFLGWIKSPSWQEFESIVVKYFRLVEVARFPNGQRLREDKSQNLSLGSGALRKSLRIEITSQGLIRKGLWYDYQLCQMSDMSRWLSDVKYGRYDCQINHETSVRRLWENLWGSRIWFIRHIACLLVKGIVHNFFSIVQISYFG